MEGLKMASEDWLSSYKKRRPILSLRQPETTSLVRATSFNADNVGQFYNNLEEVLRRYKFEGHQVWNVDETGLTTIQKRSKILAEKGKKQIGRVTSGEKGATVTMELAAVVEMPSEISYHLSCIFPQVHFKPHFIRQGSTDCTGAAHPNGWITGSIFHQFMEHFHKHVPSSVDSPTLLLLDNHISHLSSSILDYCKQNLIVLVSFLPHTSHHLQPLDFGPLKKYYYTACSNWMNSHLVCQYPSMISPRLPGKLLQMLLLPGTFESRRRNQRGKKTLKTAAPKRKLQSSASEGSGKEAHKNQKKKRQQLAARKTDSSDDEEDSLCIVCLEAFSNSESGEEWIQCRACKKWAHVHCGGDDPLYTCVHCSSDIC
ncbi:hypothetical protein NQ318_007330 [Aromia moschata]|uniref:DDE-1 domain-containing protein n=1 Tax=Aromia moschata TaxID=1265417 RepID=A0AAV8YYK4_9CUCU|nr:hypothetical protein NQ318_007330 [Aromia moschata]